VNQQGHRFQLPNQWLPVEILSRAKRPGFAFMVPEITMFTAKTIQEMFSSPESRFRSMVSMLTKTG
jgi:hypothetical protein